MGEQRRSRSISKDRNLDKQDPKQKQLAMPAEQREPETRSFAWQALLFIFLTLPLYRSVGREDNSVLHNFCQAVHKEVKKRVSDFFGVLECDNIG